MASGRSIPGAAYRRYLGMLKEHGALPQHKEVVKRSLALSFLMISPISPGESVDAEICGMSRIISGTANPPLPIMTAE
jgi:hypothetical protein